MFPCRRVVFVCYTSRTNDFQISGIHKEAVVLSGSLFSHLAYQPERDVAIRRCVGASETDNTSPEAGRVSEVCAGRRDSHGMLAQSVFT